MHFLDVRTAFASKLEMEISLDQMVHAPDAGIVPSVNRASTPASAGKKESW